MRKPKVKNKAKLLWRRIINDIELWSIYQGELYDRQKELDEYLNTSFVFSPLNYTHE